MNSSSSSSFRRVASLRALVVAAIGALALAGCSSADAPDEVEFAGEHVSAATFAAATEVAGVTVIDVRTPEEFDAGHLPGAINVDVQAADFGVQVSELEVAGDYAVYCRSGNRSAAAIDLMAQEGIANTIGLAGGIGAWTGDVVGG
ncbi:rhodanese-like domain-containing protein [Demequina aurantiaca]|uniref:rhodanese-like domain-containing protein n=1 Tax=Demequina aurantiaca TaxID=676200 RepID=UPI003D352713